MYISINLSEDEFEDDVIDRVPVNKDDVIDRVPVKSSMPSFMLANHPGIYLSIYLLCSTVSNLSIYLSIGITINEAINRRYDNTYASYSKKTISGFYSDMESSDSDGDNGGSDDNRKGGVINYEQHQEKIIETPKEKDLVQFNNSKKKNIY
jgi:hypothetical protein